MGGTVTEWLFLRHATAAPIIILAAKERLVNIVRANLSLDREWFLMILKTPLEMFNLESLKRDSLVLKQIWVQERSQMLFALLLLARQILSLDSLVHIARTPAVQTLNLCPQLLIGHFLGSLRHPDNLLLFPSSLLNAFFSGHLQLDLPSKQQMLLVHCLFLIFLLLLALLPSLRCTVRSHDGLLLLSSRCLRLLFSEEQISEPGGVE